MSQTASPHRPDRPHPSSLGIGPDADLQQPTGATGAAGPGPAPAREVVLIDQAPAMSDEELLAAFAAARQEAKNYNERLSSACAAALRLYNGEPFGDEEPGRSQLVLTEVKDTIAAMMPTVVRVFAGAEHPVLVTPNADGDEDQAKQATDYVQHVVFNECDGFRAIHDSAIDAFQLKAGWIRWWWDSSVDVKTERYTGLLEPQCAALITQPGVKAMRVVRRPATDEEKFGLQGSPESALIHTMPGIPLLLYDVTLTRRASRNQPRVQAYPSEQVWIDPDAAGPRGARGLFIVRPATVSELVAEGFSEESLLPHVSTTAPQNDRVTRKRDRLAASVTRTERADPAMRTVIYTEGWVRVDYDGDGIAELRYIRSVGDDGQTIIAHEPASHIPVARICPFFVPHRAIGESYADRVGDLQVVSSRVMRNILDSMAESIHPRTVIQDGAVPVDDVLNTEMGAIIRERVSGAVRELQKPFIGPAALPILDVLSAIKESRTGITRGSQGLTAEALQSTAPIAVSAQLSAAQDRMELALRCIAEGLRDLYAGVLTLMCEHQDRPRMVRLRGKWTPVDPRAWMSGFSVTVDVAVGRGTMAERLQVLAMIAGKQEAILQQFGPSNPLVSIGQYRNTLGDMLNASGIANTDRYFQDVPVNWAPPPPPQQPSPDELLAQVEVQKSNNLAQTEALATRQKQQEMLLTDDRERDQAKVDAMLKAADLMGKYPHLTLDNRAISALLDRDPALSLAIMSGALGGSGALGESGALGPPGGGVPGAPGAAPQIPPPPQARPPVPGQSLADARMFLPPQLITALAQLDHATGPQAPGPPQVR